jgi:hypothetical protein
MAEAQAKDPKAIFTKDPEAIKQAVKPVEVLPEAPVKPQKPIIEAPATETDKVSTPVQTTPESPIIQEAKKYKSAEEFVNSQGLSSKKSGDMTYFTDKSGNKIQTRMIEGDNLFGINLIEADKKGTGIGSKLINFLKDYADQTGKTLQIGDITNQKFFDKFPFLKKVEGMDTVRTYSSGEDILGNVQSKITILENQLGDYKGKTLGTYDPKTGIIANTPLGEKVERLENLQKAKTYFISGKITKSQLTDIWNKAQEKPSLPKKETPTITEISKNLEKQDEVAEVTKLKQRKTQLEKDVKRILKEKPKTKPRSESPIINRINKLLDDADKINPNLDTTSHKEQLKLASDKILKDPGQAYNEAISDKTDNKVLKTTLLGVFLEKGKQNNDTKAIGETAMALAEHGRRVGQEMEMIKATIETDPTNRLLIELANTKLKNVEAKYGKQKIDGKEIDVVARKKAKSKAEITDKTDKAFKVKDAQKLLDKIMCPY